MSVPSHGLVRFAAVFVTPGPHCVLPGNQDLLLTSTMPLRRFLRLVLTRQSRTDYFQSNALVYQYFHMYCKSVTNLLRYLMNYTGQDTFCQYLSNNLFPVKSPFITVQTLFPVRCKSWFTMPLLTKSYHFNTFLISRLYGFKAGVPKCTQDEILPKVVTRCNF